MSFCFLTASCLGYPIPNGSSNSFSNVHCRLISPAHPKFNPRGNETALPLLILPNKYASDGFSIYPHKIFGKLLQANIIPCPDEHPVTIKSTALLSNKILIQIAISI
ncbi:Uncharacterised protein [Clostridioides difficile]|nr:Uncharacterised protein [Clostridioides difficile]